jgi:L-lactate dehydrogenase complex protein LldF
MRAFKTFMGKRKWLNMVKPGLKNMGMQIFFGKSWGKRRELPKMAPKSFHDLWKEQQ